MKIRLLLAALLLMLSSAAPGVRFPPPPNRSNFLGLWFGYEESHLNFFRLRLEDDSTGVLVVLEGSAGADVYALHWELKAGKLLIRASPISKDHDDSDEIVCSTTTIDSLRINIVITGRTKKDWKRSAFLHPEKEFYGNIQEAAKLDPKRTPR